jgi:hypothetical protein
MKVGGGGHGVSANPMIGTLWRCGRTHAGFRRDWLQRHLSPMATKCAEGREVRYRVDAYWSR